jgi:hypothetical protein
MRLWSLHPRYLDSRGLVALWREGLLAQAVLAGRTRGYRHHPQLLRFRIRARPRAAIAAYLQAVHAQAEARGYRFDAGKLGRTRDRAPLTVTRGQLELEWAHLLAKLARRDPQRHARLAGLRRPRPHPLFRVVPGRVEPWEKAPRGPAPRRGTRRA